jgi:hypothetical protein
MMKRDQSILIIVAITIFITTFLVLSHQVVYAQKSYRQFSITSATILYHRWQLIFGSDQSPACDILIEHEDQPTLEEIRFQCGRMLSQAFRNSQECQPDPDTTMPSCGGIFLREVGLVYGMESQRQPAVELSLSGCDYPESESYCVGHPTLALRAVNSNSEQGIIEIRGSYNSRNFSCGSDVCDLSLEVTDPQGWLLTFQGDYSARDVTQEYDAVIRVLAVNGKPDAYNVDVASEAWDGSKPLACADLWRVFPDSFDSPTWLKDTDNVSELHSGDSLYYLAAALIKGGIVDASGCADNGLANSVTANECGLAMASPRMNQWQNQFDQIILDVAHEDNVPPLLLKNLFLQESQLWPGTYHDIKEVGLG